MKTRSENEWGLFSSRLLPPLTPEQFTEGKEQSLNENRSNLKMNPGRKVGVLYPVVIWRPL